MELFHLIVQKVLIYCLYCLFSEKHQRLNLNKLLTKCESLLAQTALRSSILKSSEKETWTAHPRSAAAPGTDLPSPELTITLRVVFLSLALVSQKSLIHSSLASVNFLCHKFFYCCYLGVDHILFNVEILSNEEREWHESFSLVLGPDDPVEAVLGEVTMATVTILDQEAAGSLILPAPPIVSLCFQPSLTY